MNQKPLTTKRAAEALRQAREDIALLMSRRVEDQAEYHRLLQITGELYEGITGEEVEPVQLRAVAS